MTSWLSDIQKAKRKKYKEMLSEAEDKKSLVVSFPTFQMVEKDTHS